MWWRVFQLHSKLPLQPSCSRKSRRMLKISRNLRMFGYVPKALIVILWAVFLIHPGRFSTMSYDLVSDQELHRAVFTFTGRSLPQSDCTDNILTLQQLQRDAISARNHNMAQPLLSSCNSAGICNPKDARKSLPLVALVVPYRSREIQLGKFN